MGFLITCAQRKDIEFKILKETLAKNEYPDHIIEGEIGKFIKNRKKAEDQQLQQQEDQQQPDNQNNNIATEK